MAECLEPRISAPVRGGMSSFCDIVSTQRSRSSCESAIWPLWGHFTDPQGRCHR